MVPTKQKNTKKKYPLHHGAHAVARAHQRLVQGPDPLLPEAIINTRFRFEPLHFVIEVRFDHFVVEDRLGISPETFG